MNYIDAFDAKDRVHKICVWIRQYYAEFSLSKKAVIGISGGKDSTVAAYLLCEVLGKDRVVGVSIPNGEQPDMEDVDMVFNELGIQRYTINIDGAYTSLLDNLTEALGETSDSTIRNLPPRLRMATLYAVAQSVDGLVVNTCNLSEDYIGWSTKWGDSVGDFSLFYDYTCSEVIAMGEVLLVPDCLLYKDPSDGLCGKTDEAMFGFTYSELDNYLRAKEVRDFRSYPDDDIIARIKEMHHAGMHKYIPIPHPQYGNTDRL